MKVIYRYAVKEIRDKKRKELDKIIEEYEQEIKEEHNKLLKKYMKNINNWQNKSTESLMETVKQIADEIDILSKKEILNENEKERLEILERIKNEWQTSLELALPNKNTLSNTVKIY